MAHIKVYSTPTCPYCTMAKQYLSSKNVVFQNIDVSQDQTAAAEIVKKSGQMGVPVIDIDGQLVIGFDRQRIDALLINT